MNRRDFLKRMALAGLAVATPKLIFDLGANKHKYIEEFPKTMELLRFYSQPGLFNGGHVVRAISYEDVMEVARVGANEIIQVPEMPIPITDIDVCRDPEIFALYQKFVSGIDNYYKIIGVSDL